MQIKSRFSVIKGALFVVLAFSFTSANASAASSKQDSQTQLVKIETQEVTRPDVAVSPDGKWLVFTALGHLFRLPVDGGTAEQLTFGPYFDSDPAISPNGKKVVFASDRDLKNNGNLFILDLNSGDLHQLTEEKWAARPHWSPDGRSIAYLSYERQGMWSEYEYIAPDGVLANVRQITPSSSKIETLTETPGLIRSVFHLPDGRIAWTVLGGDEGKAQAKPAPTQSWITVADNQGKASKLLTVSGVVDRVVSVGNAFYVRRYPIPAPGFLVPQPEEIAYISLSGGDERKITQLTSPQQRPAFAVFEDIVFLGERGRLWKIDAATGKREAIPFTASIDVETYSSSQPPRYTPTQVPDGTSTSILDPRLSKDGKTLFFTAAGYLWRQPLDGGTAQRIIDDEGFQWGPAVISPDGRHLAYQHSEGNLQELRVVDIDKGAVRTLLAVDRSGRFEPAWSPDGRQLVYVTFKSMFPSLYIIDVASGQSRKVLELSPRWMPRPHFSADGKHIYYTDRNQVWRVPLSDGSEPEPVTQFKGRHIADGTISPDGNWLAYRYNEEIWVARIKGKPISGNSVRRLTDNGGLNFSFTPDSRALAYATGATVWRHPLDDGRRTKIPVNLKFPNTSAPPILIRNVGILDFDANGFSKPMSLFINGGRIQWVGSENGRTIPSDARVIEGGGRFAIPGLFDSHTHVATPIHFNPARDVSRMSGNLAFGVTSVRDMGSDITLVKAWEDRRKYYGAPAPRIFSGGAMTETAGPFFHGGSLFAGTEDEARGIVRKETRDGVIAIKSYFTLPWSLQRAIADEARKLNIPVVAHGLTFRETVMGPVLGRASIEHQPTPIRLYGDVLQLLAKSGTRWCPTIAPTGGNGVLLAQQPQLLSDPKLRAFTSQGDYALAGEVALFSMLDPKIIGKAYADLLASVRQGHALGVKLLAGTDALNPNVFYGHGLHMELKHLARSGIPSIDILRLATIESAASVGADHILGEIKPGKLADIVLLDENPLNDISNAMSIWRVIQDGRVFSSHSEVEER